MCEREPLDNTQITPISIPRINELLERRDLHVLHDEDGDIRIPFPATNLLVCLAGDENQVLRVTGRWNVNVPIHARQRLLDEISDWNRAHHWPTCSIYTDDSGNCRVGAEVDSPVESGLTQAQLDQFLHCSISTILQFLEHLDNTYPDTRFGPDPLLKG